MTLSVLVVGPAPVREGLRALLAQEEDFALAAEEGTTVSDRSPPDVIVCYADAPDTVRDLRTRWPQADMLVVADLGPDAAHALRDLGAIGLFPLTAEPDELVWAVRNVAQGKLTLPPTVLRALVAHLAEAENAPPLSPPVQLTARSAERRDGFSGGSQQIRGSNSPAGKSTTREPPMPVRAMTSPE
ncbi:MAG: response regulator transcription factor [Chloroflexi bacterium]|nr:response regulator transcription factor [Chloroflexota bacterium]